MHDIPYTYALTVIAHHGYRTRLLNLNQLSEFMSRNASHPPAAPTLSEAHQSLRKVEELKSVLQRI